MKKFNRRGFLKSTALATIPTLSAGSSLALGNFGENAQSDQDKSVVFIYDGINRSPIQFLKELQKINSISPIQADSYGKGGAVEDLEKKFAEITGKEKAIYIPTGTLANQLAIAALSGSKDKIIVQDISHINRDEADANIIFNKKLVPLADKKTYFTAEELKAKIKSLPSEEYFYSGIGAISIENPVRRADGEFIPLDELKKIKEVCDAESITMHLDGARLYLASAWSGVSIQDYSSLFDTVYISLYKYLGANGGAILCGSAELIDQLPKQIKIHGGNISQNWTNAAMALHQLETIEEKLKEVKRRSNEVLKGLESIEGVNVELKKNSTNIYFVELPSHFNIQKINQQLLEEFKIVLLPARPSNRWMLMMNETLLNQSSETIVNAFLICLTNPKNLD